MDLNNLITVQKDLREYTLSNFYRVEDGRNRGFHPNLPTNLSVFTLKIEHQNLSFYINFIGLRGKSPLICFFPEIISNLEKIIPNILKRLLIF